MRSVVVLNLPVHFASKKSQHGRVTKARIQKRHPNFVPALYFYDDSRSVESHRRCPKDAMQYRHICDLWIKSNRV